MKIAWTIAASDSSAGAGIQADLAVFAQFKIHGCSVLSKVTAQNSQGIIDSFPLPAPIFAKQLQALNVDLPASAIKISVIASQEQLAEIVNFCRGYTGKLIYDPVIKSSTNTVLTDMKLLDTIKNQLLPTLDLLTPNIPEAELLTGLTINTPVSIIMAGKELLKMGVKNVLLKGGHQSNTNFVSDLFINSEQSLWLYSPRNKKNTQQNIHGTGCHLSAAITANLALGYELTDALVIAKLYINAAIRNSYLPIPTSGQAYLPQFNCARLSQDLPKIVDNYDSIKLFHNLPRYLPIEQIGLYPIVESSDWVAKLATFGVKTIQLRIKTLTMPNLENEIIRSIQIANTYQIKLFINDHWQLAIKHRAFGVHLGQEDLLTADLALIQQHNLRLGISSHNYEELARAKRVNPSYIALGPIYPTTSKIMPWQPQGLLRIQEWLAMLDCPLVVIGGINTENIDQVISAGAQNIAMISAITLAKNPQSITKALLNKLAAVNKENKF